MLIKKETEYAVLSLISIGQKEENVFHDVKELAKELKIPPALLSKIFQKLATADIVESKFGPGGGYKLTRSPKKISLWHIFNAMQTSTILKCYAGKAPYCCHPTCPLQNVVLKIENQLIKFLSHTSLFELINDSK